jgi:hypothetical protein
MNIAHNSNTLSMRAPISKNSSHRNDNPIKVVAKATIVNVIPWRVTPKIPRAGFQLHSRCDESPHQLMFVLIDMPKQE